MCELEICAGDVASVFAAHRAGATGVEICTGLAMGGLTPPASMLDMTQGLEGMYRHVLLRPRAGDFLYSSLEFTQMLEDARSCAVQRCDGLVVGILDRHGNVDKARCAELIAQLPGREHTFHRAFDMVSNPEQALEDIIELGFARVLTSGCSPSAAEGVQLLGRLVRQAAGRIKIMAGGGVRPQVIPLLKQAGIECFHASASHRVESGMEWRNQATKMSAESLDEYGFATTDEHTVKLLKQAIF